jgi:hypothetical protein
MSYATARHRGALAPRKDTPPMAGSADFKGATVPPPDTRRSYS